MIESQKREVTMHRDKMGNWHLKAKECPLKKFTDKMGIDQPICASGIGTRKGVLKLASCKHTTTDSLIVESFCAFLRCRYKPEKIK